MLLLKGLIMNHRLNHWHEERKCVMLSTTRLIMCDIKYVRPCLFSLQSYEPLLCIWCEGNVFIFFNLKNHWWRQPCPSSSSCDACKGDIETGTDSNGTVCLWRGSHIQKKKPTPWDRQGRTLKYSFLTWGSHYSGFRSTQYHCSAERNVSDVQDIKRWVSLLGFVLLFLTFVNGHRQTHEDFRADCSKSVVKRLKEVMAGF